MNGPLQSIRVVDLTRLLPGPYCTMFLADFGAEVIKIEEPILGDYTRWEEPKAETDSAIFSSLNRNKKSVTLNLKSDQGKELFKELIKTADVLVESFRPGVMDRLGLGYDTLKTINPRLIYCAITGFGQTGPYAKMPGHDLNYLSYAGLLQLQGERKQKPFPPPVQIADIGGGSLMAVMGILTAVIARNETGKGQFIDISMLDGTVSWLQTILPNYLANHELPKRGELPLSGSKACYEVYETADQRYLSVAALEEKFWVEFCKGIERVDFIGDLHAPQNKQDELKLEIGKIMKTKTLYEWLNVFANFETCISPVLTFAEMTEDPQIRERGMIQEIPGLDGTHIGIPIKLSDTPGSIQSIAPKLGEHNEQIYKALGMKKEKIDSYIQEGII
ncbi:CaiB/BaiF CoA transferase family protein [Bacillus benzoevorans]|uniref:Crotonobetainyl-CoA:carnitine CoA-transferase CaiB-like acyl-CoA transferase n=1 Tax=Bacillus benzoevorans TaxID=1456 RepID=A0A7X0LW18_9BACI|nr:CaiB/BaiF CoA-transferase family protein [Bacillus benzoevorans]MBB6446606.1 crotonobetainyl-CoA:carnitine CoA-transferase CaiB-like acyl-CoA transferase [Bacillus benzoevorans]